MMNENQAEIRIAIAALAMQGFINTKSDRMTAETIAENAVQYADALLIELAKSKAPNRWGRR